MKMMILCLSILLFPAAAMAEPAELRVTAKGLRSSEGSLRCAVYRSEKGFPDKSEHAAGRTETPVKNKAATCVFRGLAPGKYAVSFIHDEDNDRELDTNFLGIPKEGYGFGNDAEGSMGPPDFEKAVIQVRAGEQTIELTTRY